MSKTAATGAKVETKSTNGTEERQPIDGGGLVLELGEEDFARVLGGMAQVKGLMAPTSVLDQELLAKNAKQRILEKLPKVLVRRLEGMLPDTFELREVVMKICIDARVFGSGIAGEATVKFGPKDQK